METPTEGLILLHKFFLNIASHFELPICFCTTKILKKNENLQSRLADLISTGEATLLISALLIDTIYIGMCFAFIIRFALFVCFRGNYIQFDSALNLKAEITIHTI